MMKRRQTVAFRATTFFQRSGHDKMGGTHLRDRSVLCSAIFFFVLAYTLRFLYIIHLFADGCLAQENMSYLTRLVFPGA